MRRFAVALSMAILAWGCDSGPSGPGDFLATVEPPDRDVGGVVVEVVGKGIEAFSGAGGTRVFWARRGMENTYRVVVVAAEAGHPQFQVRVRDVGDGKPRATVVSVVDGDNLTLPATDSYRVRFTR